MRFFIILFLLLPIYLCAQPDQVASGHLVTWIEMDRLVSYGDSGFISIGNLADDSTTYYDQATTTLQPDRGIGRNGLPYLQGDGTDDFMSRSAVSSFTDGYEEFAVFQFVSSSVLEGYASPSWAPWDASKQITYSAIFQDSKNILHIVSDEGEASDGYIYYMRLSKR